MKRLNFTPIDISNNAIDNKHNDNNNDTNHFSNNKCYRKRNVTGDKNTLESIELHKK